MSRIEISQASSFSGAGNGGVWDPFSPFSPPSLAELRFKADRVAIRFATMSHFLALDQGTTSSRAVVFTADGQVLGASQHEFTQYFPQPGYVEHDPEQIYETQWRAALEAVAAAGDPEISAVGITNQRETVVVFDRNTGVEIHPAIVWQDRRTASQLEALREHEEVIRAKTGLTLDPYFSAAKIALILDTVPGARARAERGELGACTIDAWLLYRLTSGRVFATEPSNASRTSLYSLAGGDWDDDLLEIFRVPRACLPEIRPTAGAFGRVEGKGWPICAMIGDQQAALFGQGCYTAGTSKCTYGTGSFLLANCGRSLPVPEQGLLGTVAWRLGEEDTFALEGSVLVAGAAVQWLRDGLGIIDSSAEVETLARSVPDSGGVIFVPAFAGLGTPYWDPDARGLLIGMTRGTTAAHIARAALEAIALQVCDVQRTIEAVTGESLAELRVDGGAAQNELLLQIQATLSGLDVLRPANVETTVFGAARMAMLGTGMIACPEDLPEPPGDSLRKCPGEGVLNREDLLRAWSEAVSRARAWAKQI